MITKPIYNFFKKTALVLFISTMVGCKPKQLALDSSLKPNENKQGSIAEIVENHYSHKANFSTLYIKSNVRFSDEKQTQNVGAEIKIKKDEQILISVRFLGITMAKALITPTSVSYYEKINSTYFEGDFSGLSQWLGIELDYSKIQNMLLGEAFDDLKAGKYSQLTENQVYSLIDLQSGATQKKYWLDSQKYWLIKQEIEQAEQERKIQVNYADFNESAEGNLPKNILINTFQKKGKSEISLNYNGISFNEELSFPYSIPSGYKRITIK